MNSLSKWSVVIITLVSGFTTFAADPTDRQIEFFESRIRPVLAERCYGCHNSAEKSEGGLEIDWRGGIADAEIIAPGNPAESHLMAVLRHEIEGLEMPEDGPKLDQKTVADFERWIAMGAPDPRDQPPSQAELEQVISWDATLKRRKLWWSFQPIQNVRPPRDVSWSSHPIDRFIFAKQQQLGLTPAKPADDAVLIRRLFFNLVGLPPSGDQVLLWSKRLAEDRQRAVEELSDELIDSPHFGERWARHWMDWIRYAESHGSEGDPRIDNAWYYRDYLIRAINGDVPYDQLVREHVAGDLLPQPRINEELGINESIIGPAHWRMVFHGFAPTDALDEKVRFVDDQVNAFSKAFLGLTVSCARCHDHKFDAISQKDYYALFGILASCRPARAVVDLPERQTRNSDRLAALKPSLRHAIASDWLDAIPSLRARLVDSDGPVRAAEKKDQLLHALYLIGKAAEEQRSVSKSWQRQQASHAQDKEARQSFDRVAATRRWNLADSGDLASWYNNGTGLSGDPQAAGEFAVAAEGDRALVGIYPSGVYSHRLSSKHSARLTSPDLNLDQDSELWVQVIGDGAAMARYVVQDYPRSGTVYPVTNLNGKWLWQRYDLTYWKGDSIHVEFATAKDAPLLVKGDERSWFGARRVAVVAKGSPGPGANREFLDPLFDESLPLPESWEDAVDRYTNAIAAAARKWRDGTIDDAGAMLLGRCLAEGLLPNELDQLPTAKPLIAEYRELESDVPAARRIPGLDETHGREQRLLIRGNHKSPGDIIPRRFLEAIDPTPYQGRQSGRAELAEDLLRDDNPLTRRVIVNRIWHHLFGAGIVGTPDNFGRLGMQPTHPQLLDYLATQFRDDGWSVKKLIRSIVLSKTWQQSAVNQRSTDADPQNKFLARANVRRLEAEGIRDSMLKVSGRLDEELYGAPASGNSSRRSVYVQVIRNRLDPFLRAFDFPEPFSSTGRRDVTNVPAQSLMLMNDPAVIRLAGAWAETVLRDRDQSDAQRIQNMFLAALGRPATAEEIEQAGQYLAETVKEHDELLAERQALQRQLDDQRRHLDAIIDPVRQRMIAALKKQSADGTLGPQPIARWEFDSDLRDAMGSLHGSAKAGARLDGGALVVDSGEYVVTVPLEKTLKAKTMEAWVRLSDLDQRGGGVMTVQTRDGHLFDSIVIGEKDPRQWLAGSNNFSRTQSFDAPRETDATDRFVHVAITYDDDGTITGYRDGKPYGQPYQSNGPLTFKPGDTIVSFGVRHLPPGGNRMLSGRIAKARLYDRALTPAEIWGSASSTPFVDEAQVLAKLDQAERNQVKAHREKIEQIEQQIQSLGPVPEQTDQRAVWTDFARAMFTFKEFVYIR